MAEELQGLLDRIHQEGIKKADDEKNTIIQAAKTQAEEIVNAAKQEAAEIRKQSETDAANNEARGKSAVSQAARSSFARSSLIPITRKNLISPDCFNERTFPTLE